MSQLDLIALAKPLPFRTDITGDSSSKRGLLVVTDAFGIETRVQYGADLLADRLEATVLIPDLFLGEAAKMEWFPPNTPEKQELVSGWEHRFENDSNIYPRLMDCLAEAKKKLPSVRSWGIYGLCFGGGKAVEASEEGSPFKVSGQCHPGLDHGSQKNITIPHILLASKDEDPEIVQDYREYLSGPGKIGIVETYSKMHHGWMGANNSFSTSDELQGYFEGYRQLGDFFAKNM
ncbi:hypothetical protein MMC18_008964 [Xylographa bjoerkii]|nr:hypothetical protein [Xylographa bjoerkii]